MSAILGSLLSALWLYLAAAGAALVSLLTAYGKGRSDQKSKIETKDLRDANDIRKQGADALALPLLLSGCVPKTGGGETRAALCDQFRPVRWSVSDTDVTIAQNQQNNAVGVRVCGWTPRS